MSFVMGAREPGRKMKKLHTLPEYTLLEKRACEQRSSANSSQEVKKRQALSLFSAERKKALRQISMDVCVGVYVLLCWFLFMVGNSLFSWIPKPQTLLGNTPRLWGNHEQKGGAVKKDSGFVTGRRLRTKNRLPKSRITTSSIFFFEKGENRWISMTAKSMSLSIYYLIWQHDNNSRGINNYAEVSFQHCGNCCTFVSIGR